MTEPRVTRPRLPEGYVENPIGLVPWAQVVDRLSHAKNYWLCSVRPNGRPHTIPKWGVWIDGKIYSDGSPETRHGRNIASNPHVAVHLESGDAALIVEGTCRSLGRPSPELASELAQAYRAKYAESGCAPDAHQGDDGGLFEVTPRTVITWTKFIEDPTKFVFEHAERWLGDVGDRSARQIAETLGNRSYLRRARQTGPCWGAPCHPARARMACSMPFPPAEHARPGGQAW